jgi:RNA polymerase sigma factor (sigma-70 family)
VQLVTDPPRPVPAVDGEAAPDDPTGFGIWVGPHLSAMARLATRMAPPADSEDIVQEALVRAWSKRKQFDHRRGLPSSWLLAITADQARKALRRSRPVGELGDRAAPTVLVDDRLDLETMLQKLPARQRLAVDCYYFVGLSIAETAAVMGCAEGTVKWTLSEARRQLHDLIEER